MPRLRVLILARIPLIREGLRGLLAEERDLQVSLLAPSVELLDDLLADEPDVLLLDVDVLEKEGWDLLDELRRALPTLTILVISDNAQDRRMPQAIALGARGYLLRESSAEEMANAIRAAHSGTLVLHPQIAATLLESVRAAALSGGGDDTAQDLIEPLSERELDVLRLMTRGMSNKQIAGELYITEHTVKFHIRAILGKLGAANRTEAVTLALQKGLVSL
ncbi:MAG TPA: response regulator transcription factor [Anaerolineae bacterium]|nr:response regulator transcription factor [Anaerolineae bacterium]